MSKRVKRIQGFGQSQLRILAKMLSLAREIAGEHYKLSGEELARLPVEIRTLADLQEFEIHSGEVLAYIARYGYEDPRLGRVKDLYRVNVQDHNILDRLIVDEGGIEFSPLLLYVLTHELIHVIRFIKFLTPFHQGDSDKLLEERRVHALTRKLLRKIPLNGMDKVLDKYGHLAL